MIFIKKQHFIFLQKNTFHKHLKVIPYSTCHTPYRLKNMNNTNTQFQLITAARNMQKQALCTYSNFAVGAALISSDNIIVGGFNIESASYGLTMCAERVALYSALTHGHRHFTHIALVTNTASFPCGACRQMLYEFCSDAQLIIATPTDIVTSCSLQSLLPHAFAQNDLDITKKG